MSISFLGAGSGLPISNWIDALIADRQTSIDKLKSNRTSINTAMSTLNNVESLFRSLKLHVETFTDSNIVSAFDIFKRKSGSTSDDKKATISVSNNAVIQDITLKINQLATVSKATSVEAIGNVATGSTTIKQLVNDTNYFHEIKEDEDPNQYFSIYVDNVQYKYAVAKDGSTTLDDIINQINNDFTNGEVVASVTADGRFRIDVDNTQVSDFKLGSTTDDSNFLNIVKLKKYAENPDNPVTSDNIDYVESDTPLNTLKYQGKLVGNEAGLKTEVTTGTFTIGSEEFTITENTTLGDLIAQINNSEKAGVTASLDTRTNKLILTAKNPGELTINIKAGTSNFTDVMGLTRDGKIIPNSQQLGKNAQVELNGVDIEAASNTLTSDITGITGVTINLLETTFDKESNEHKEVSLKIKNDTTELTTAVNNFISKFNEIVDKISAETSSSGNLKGEYTLVTIKNTIRQMLTSPVSGLSNYNNFAAIGISTGKVGASVTDNTNHFQFDESKFLEALNKNPEEVRALLIGDESKGITGIMQQLEEKLESWMDIENGYFAAREDSYESQISQLNNTITRRTEQLEAYREQLIKKYTAMDTKITQMQSQLSALNF